MSHQLPAIYEQFVDRVFVKDRSQIRDLSFVNDFARQFTGVWECAFGAVGECGCCGQTILNVEPFVEAAPRPRAADRGEAVNAVPRHRAEGRLERAEHRRRRLPPAVEQRVGLDHDLLTLA